MKYIVGVDPGLYGAISLLRADGSFNGSFVQVWDMPIMPNGKGGAKIKNQLNPAALLKILSDASSDGTTVAYMEAVTSMPRDAQSIAFSLGDSFGTVRAVLACMGIPVTLVLPRLWKKYFNLLKLDKDFARTKAQQLYPTAPLELKKHCGRADAILIARYGGVQP